MARLVRYNVYLRLDEDRELITWLEGQKSTSGAIRDRLKLSETGRAGTVVDVKAIQEAVIQAMDNRNLSLEAIRRVVEAAIHSALTAGATITADADDEGESWLDNLILE